jgi:hypothetical protein
MSRLAPALSIAILLLACTPPGSRVASDPVQEDAAVVDAKAPVKPPTTNKDAAPSSTPDTGGSGGGGSGGSGGGSSSGGSGGSSSGGSGGGSGMGGAGGSGGMGGTAGDGGTSGTDAGGGSGGSGGTGGTGGSDASSGGGPVTEASWPRTGCNQGALKFPNIDKNMGKFPPGSCPPPETLKRDCGGDSKIKVMTATASAWETGYYHPAQYAVDEYLMTRWSSPSGPTAWLAMDLGSEQTFKRIYLAWELAHATDYDIVISNDGTTWMPLKQVRGGNGDQDIVDVEGKARHVRINGVTRGKTGTELYGYSLFDVTICGERP